MNASINGGSLYPALKSSVLPWVEGMRVANVEYRFGKGLEPNLFSSIFALFILDLFNESKNISGKERIVWRDFINGFQDPATGYYVPSNYAGQLVSKTVHQLTAFSLSALNILEAEPKYELSFVKDWDTPEKVEDYLVSSGCMNGAGKSGNAAMFLAIFLTHQYERDKRKNDYILDLIEKWFELHDKSQNPATGFWGNNEVQYPFLGFQNALHQFIVYYYWGRKINYHEKIVDGILNLQSYDGFFAPYHGGSSCYEYDAADILINCGYKNNYRVHDLHSSLKYLMHAILESQNHDGGFCESKKMPYDFKDLSDRNYYRFLFQDSDISVVKHKILVSVKYFGKNYLTYHWHCGNKTW